MSKGERELSGYYHINYIILELLKDAVVPHWGVLKKFLKEWQIFRLKIPESDSGLNGNMLIITRAKLL